MYTIKFGCEVGPNHIGNGAEFLGVYNYQLVRNDMFTRVSFRSVVFTRCN